MMQRLATTEDARGAIAEHLGATGIEATIESDVVFGQVVEDLHAEAAYAVAEMLGDALDVLPFEFVDEVVATYFRALSAAGERGPVEAVA